MASGPTPDSSEMEKILGARNGVARGEVRLIEEKVRDLLTSGARALKHLDNPVLKAEFAVLVLDKIAQQLGDKIPPQAFAKLWGTEKFRDGVAEPVLAFKEAFSLHAEVLQGFRETEPEFAFQYLLYKGLFFGRLPLLTSDLKDTLSTFVHSKRYDTLTPKEKRDAAGFRGVREAIETALKLGPVFIVTGDTHDTVVEQFLLPNEWIVKDGELLRPTSASKQNLVWLPRTGMEMVCYDGEHRAFVRKPMVEGIKSEELPVLRELLETTFHELEIAEHFADPQRRYAYKPSKKPGSIEERPGEEGDKDYSIAFFPAGVLETAAREEFKKDPKNAALLEVAVCHLNGELATLGLEHIIVKRGGLSTIDLVTSDKGVALELIKRDFAKNNELLVFIGDRIALHGNDVEAISVADVSIQVGIEWDSHLFPPGNRMLLRSKRLASEGGSAEFISALSRVRRLGLTELLAPPPVEATATQPSQTALIEASLPVSLEREKGLFENAVRLADQLLTASQDERAAIGAELKTSLERLDSSHPALQESAFAQLEILLLKRAVKGEVPVIATDIKDTLAHFDCRGFEWFPEVRETFGEALRDGKTFLLTGDSLHNLRDRFLLPAGIIDRSDSHFRSEFPGIHNLYLVTRTGLDLVNFNFSKGELERFPLISGIAQRDVAAITDLLHRTTEEYLCARIFEEFRHEADRPPGYIDIRGQEYGKDAVSFSFFPAGVLLKEEREKFRKEMMGNHVYRAMIGFIRQELYDLGLEQVLAQHGGISTIDLTTTTKGTALAQLRRDLLGPREYFIYVGDTVTQSGNDGSTIGVADITVQVGTEQDTSLSPPPGHFHIHAPLNANNGGTAAAINLATRARKIALMNIWNGTSLPQ
ncbi:MAG: hypothetical protein J5J00_13990 [Deltaproteobacteria bacterium]|nr:hypothetical protein [Deltaproteobacteria bacterium]